MWPPPGPGVIGRIAVIPSSWSQFQAHPRMLRPVRSKAGLGSLGSALRRCLPTTASPFKAMDRRPARPDSRMSSFHEFLSAAADFALTLNLKAAIVAAGFILHAGAHAPTRGRIAPAGKAPDCSRHRGFPRPCCTTGGSTSSFGRTQRNKSTLASQFRGPAARVPLYIPRQRKPRFGRLRTADPRHDFIDCRESRGRCATNRAARS